MKGLTNVEFIALLTYLVDRAKAFREEAPAAIARNAHMHDAGQSELSPAVIDAVLVSFINDVANSRCMDLGLYAIDLQPKKEGPSINEAAAGGESSKDWRVGLTVKVKYRTHQLYYHRGTVLATFPSGHGGIADPAGVLQIKLDSGAVLLAPADEWVTA